MNNWNFNAVILVFLFFLASCQNETEVVSENSFKGRSFVGECDKKDVHLLFHESDYIVSSKNFPSEDIINQNYRIIEGDESPSGKRTISVDAVHYFIILNQNRLLYRYYEGEVERKIYFTPLAP